MRDWPYLFNKLGMSAATSGNERMYGNACDAKGARCSEGGVVRNYGGEAQTTTGRGKEKGGSKTSTSGMVGARQRWSEMMMAKLNTDRSGCIDSTYWGNVPILWHQHMVQWSNGAVEPGIKILGLDWEWHELSYGSCQT